MFPSTLSSSSTSRELSRVNARHEPVPTTPNFMTRSRIPLAERIQKIINQLQSRNEPPTTKHTSVSNVVESDSKPSSGSSRVSPSPSRFGRDRMYRAKSGHFKRPSLETNCLFATGGDSHSSSDASGFNLGSSSRLEFSPSNNIPVLESPVTRTSAVQVRARVRGHMRNAAASCSFANETIHEGIQYPDGNTGVGSPSLSLTSLQLTTPELGQRGAQRKDRETRRILEKYYALKHEAELSVTESKKEWVDTPYSITAVQNFQPPRDLESMRTLLQDSQRNFRPVPAAELRRHGRRTSRNLMSSPYARTEMRRLVSPQRAMVSHSPWLARKRGKVEEIGSRCAASSPAAPVLQDLTSINTSPSVTPMPKGSDGGEFGSKDKAMKEGNAGITPFAGAKLEFLEQGTPKLKRPLQPGGKVPKRRQKDKENVNNEIPRTPSNSLRIHRPRPKYRTPTPVPKRRLER